MRAIHVIGSNADDFPSSDEKKTLKIPFSIARAVFCVISKQYSSNATQFSTNERHRNGDERVENWKLENLMSHS